MPWSLLFNDTKHGKNHLHTSSNSIETSINIDTKEEDSEEHNWHELTIEENDVCYCYQFLKTQLY